MSSTSFVLHALPSGTARAPLAQCVLSYRCLLLPAVARLSLARHGQAPSKYPDMARGLTRNLLQGYLSASRQPAPVTADSEMPGKQSWLGIRTRRPLCVRDGRTARKSFYLHNIIQMIDTETQSRSRQERGRLDETRDSPHQPAPSALLHKWHQWPICIRS